MADADQHMNKLTKRAKEAAARVHESIGTTNDKLRSQVAEARAAADKTSQELQAKAADARDEASQRRAAMRQEWQARIDAIQSSADTKKHELSVDRAMHRANRAENDAANAVDFAYLAIEDAEWAVLDAVLARAEADELAATPV